MSCGNVRVVLLVHVTLIVFCRYVLTDIFNMVDVDMNGLLSREEFTSYSMRTGGEEVGDEEWDVVKG